MAFHDDVDDANDKTYSEHEFEIPFPRPVASNSSAASPVGGDEETEVSEAANGGVVDLDSALNQPIVPEPATPTDLPPPVTGASDSAPFDLNDEFQRSDLTDGVDPGMPPWAMAPAPDPTQAVSQLDAPDGLTEEQRAAAANVEDADTVTVAHETRDPDATEASARAVPSVDDFAPKSAASAAEDPYQIPVDYTTPDFFASRISRKHPFAGEAEAEAESDLTLEHEVNANRDSKESVEHPNEFADSAEVEDASDFSFDSLFATEDAGSGAAAPVKASDTLWAEVSPVTDSLGEVPAEQPSVANNVWKLGPLEPNVPMASAPPVDEITATEEVVEGTPMWNLDGVDAPNAAQSDSQERHAEVPSARESPAAAFSAAVSDISEPVDEFVAESLGENEVSEPSEALVPPENTESETGLPATSLASADETDSAVKRDTFVQPQAAVPTDESEVPTPPVRRSMADDELLTWVDNPENQSTGTLSVIEVLEAQLRLREEDAREYREWETTLRSQARPQADVAIEQVTPESSDSGSQDDDDTAPTPTQQAAAESSTASPGKPAVQLPTWDVPPPSDTWSPGDDFEDEIPFAAHADPTGSITLPIVDDGNSVGVHHEDESESEVVLPNVADAELSAFGHSDFAPEVKDVPVPESESESEPEPEPEQIVPHFDAEFGLLSLDGVQPNHAPAASSGDDTSSEPEVGQFESSPEFPTDEDGDYDEIPFTPPPLVEPITAPSTPRSNLDEHVSFGDFGFTPPISDEPDAATGSGVEGESVGTENDADGASPFAFALSSTSASPPSTDAEPRSSVADAIDETDSNEAIPDEVAASPVPESDATQAAFNFASHETPRYVPTVPLSFDDLLKTEDLEDSDEASELDEVNPLNAFISDLHGSVPQQGDPLSDVQTGSLPIAEELREPESDEAVDGSDRATGSADISAPHTSLDSSPIPFAAAPAAGTVGNAVATLGASSGETLAAAPRITDSSSVPRPMPLSTARASQQPLGLEDVAPTAQPVFSLEESGLDPTPIDRRVGHAARMFWLWFAANSSIVSIGLGAVVFAVGMSLRQSVVAILAGVALSFIPLGLTTLAGKRSGQPTMVISRSAFGLLGNIVPSIVALVSRLFWGAVLLWVLASSVAIVLISSELNVGLGDRQLLLITLALSFLVALVIAFAGYPLFARIQLILSIISGVLVIGLIVFTAQYVDMSQALTTPDGSWLLTITGAVLVFSFLGLVWAYSGADIARYQRVSSSGAASALSAAFGTTLPAFVLIAYGALLAASDPAIARGFLASPLDTLLLLLPGWYPVPLLLGAALSLLSGITLSLYSGGFALQSIGVRLPRQWSIVIVGVLLGLLAILLAFGVDGGINELFRDVATTLAVPTAAWVGIFASETMIRTRRLDSAALTTRGGIYADIRWVNLSAFILISVIGFALTSATIGWLSWQGYGFVALGIDVSSELAATDLGVLIALILGMLIPIVLGIPAIKRQEAGSPERAVRRA